MPSLFLVSPLILRRLIQVESVSLVESENLSNETMYVIILRILFSLGNDVGVLCNCDAVGGAVSSY